MMTFVHTIREGLQAKYIFEEHLGISARNLEGGAVEWDRDVIQKLADLQESREYRIVINGQDLDALTVAHRIMRKENFLVALVNKGLLDLSVPYLNQKFYSSSIEVSIMLGICRCESCVWFCGCMIASK
jgi:autophagy-related protein 9